MVKLITLLAIVLHLLSEVTAKAGACANSPSSCPTKYQGKQLLQVKAQRAADRGTVSDQKDEVANGTSSADAGDDKSAGLFYLEEVDENGCHKIITYTHSPMEGSTDYFAGDFPLELQDIAVAMISGRPEYFKTTHDTVLRYMPRGLLIKARGKCPCSFRAALRTLKAAHPRAKWYYVGDEDAIIDLSQLTQVLSKYNSSVPTLVAGNGGHEICRDCGACPTILTQEGLPNVKAFYGGNGQIFSAGLVEELAENLEDGCLEATVPTLSGLGDLENTCSMARAWQPHFRFVQLMKSWANFDAFQENTSNFITAHHLCVENVNRLAYVNSHLFPVRTDLVAVPNGNNDGCSVASETEQLQ